MPLNTDELLLNIISFNVGIEAGQVLALAIVLMFLATGVIFLPGLAGRSRALPDTVAV